jgi:hypothetical protein
VNELREEARADLVSLAEADPAFQLLQTIPYVGDVRAAIFIGTIVTPARFRRRQQLWAYAGFGVSVRASGEHVFVDGTPRRAATNRTRGLNRNFCRPLKRVLRQIAVSVSAGEGPLRQLFDAACGRGLKRPVARSVVARKVASIVLAVWRSGQPFDSTRFSSSCPEAASAKIDSHATRRGGSRLTVCASGHE